MFFLSFLFNFKLFLQKTDCNLLISTPDLETEAELLTD